MKLTERELLLAGMSQAGVTLTEAQTEQFLLYYKLLIEWNQKINLTAITEFEDVVLKHFVDSVSVCRMIHPEAGQTLIDVGTGAGFPGVPLKILFPALSVTLLDSLGKRVTFLQRVIETLELSIEEAPIQAFHGRAEEYAHEEDFREAYDYAVSRAVSNISVISEYCIPFLKQDGTFIAYKSVDAADEIEQYQGGFLKLGCFVSRIEEFSLKKITNSDINIQRTFVALKKGSSTPEQYPRRSGIPEKRPLK